MSVTQDSLLNLNYQNTNEQPIGLPTVSRRLSHWTPSRRISSTVGHEFNTGGFDESYNTSSNAAGKI